MNPKFFEPGGGKFFVSVTISRTREVRSSTSTTCILLKTWEEVIEHLSKHAAYLRYNDLELVEIFTKPRLCKKCLKHAAQPGMFDEAKEITECLCWVEKNSACPYHRF